jgi:hypothetical protein
MRLDQTRSVPRLLTATLGVVLALALALTAAPAQAANRVTPRNFTGYGFDQCLAPSQTAMDAWLTSSPFWAVGIYISGDSRFCRDQPNLTPEWVSTQLANGWRLLPIALGPQAWCTTRDRYRKQVRINPDPTSRYAKAAAQGRAEAVKAVDAATALGIAPRSTLWYDIEAFDIKPRDCRESALTFLSEWTNQLHELGFVSGIYSSAGSGIKMLDDAQTNRPGRYAMPDQIWVARWSGVPGRINDANNTYIRDSSWMPHKRVHQYLGGHNETHGGVTINIDSNWLDLGRGTQVRKEPAHCGGVPINFGVYRALKPGSTGALVKAAQCVLREKRLYDGRITGVYDARLGEVVRNYRVANGLGNHPNLSRRAWTKLLSTGSTPLLKYGSGTAAVRRVQRALNAADSAKLAVTGIFEATTTAAVKRYQKDHRMPATGVVTEDLWALLQSGTR